MENDETLLKKRFLELAQRADRSGRFSYTPFLGLAEQDVLMRLRSSLPLPFELFGGAEGCERVVCRFGTKELFGYDEAFPIALLCAKPVSMRFAGALSHRDILGALMALGIERSGTGDIVLIDNTAHIFCLERIAPYIEENFVKAANTVLSTSRETELPEGELYRLSRETVNVASSRLDAVAAAFTRLSRGDMQALIERGLVFIDGRRAENGSRELKEGAVVSVRGYGRFIFRGEDHRTRKGRSAAVIDRYV